MGRVGRTRSLGANALKSISFHPCESLQDYHKRPFTFHPTFGDHFFDTDQAVMDLEELAPAESVHIFYTPDTFDLFVKIEGESPQASRKGVMDCLTKAKWTKLAFPSGFFAILPRLPRSSRGSCCRQRPRDIFNDYRPYGRVGAPVLSRSDSPPASDPYSLLRLPAQLKRALQLRDEMHEAALRHAQQQLAEEHHKRQVCMARYDDS
ncbi:unnamed protein product [Vitrella brassicaformis CCMP3155]|uniref:Uncharacterized protein n=1 Tax=Vitrella brassicaformis (strain CCMP3155) TaxID=1169540 RepID=A0A0G4EAJ7_VITBC|nr:unnamed protein product [Vitrella brassicaformis CCMP3155]|eukprot:CEL92986.1 unnamed protein product [Vitrella brassicaformis CCMP3155]